MPLEDWDMNLQRGFRIMSVFDKPQDEESSKSGKQTLSIPAHANLVFPDELLICICLLLGNKRA